MSNIEITSAADQKETIIKSMGDLIPNEKVDDTESAPSPKAEGETIEESDASENEDTEVLYTKDGDDDDSDNNESDAKDGDQKPKKKNNGFKKRIDKLTSKLSAKDQEVEYWKQEALKRQVSENEKPQDKSQKTENESGRPKEEDFESHADFIEALTDWKMDKRDKERETKSKETQLKTEFDRQLEAHNKRVDKFVESHEDFHDLIHELDGIPMSLAVQEIILESENGPELMYELAKNKKEYERICALNPVHAARALGMFEAKIKIQNPSESSKEIKKTTKAPQPIAPVKANGSSSLKKTIYDPDLSQAEYEKLRREQMLKNA